MSEQTDGPRFPVFMPSTAKAGIENDMDSYYPFRTLNNDR